MPVQHSRKFLLSAVIATMVLLGTSAISIAQDTGEQKDKDITTEETQSSAPESKNQTADEAKSATQQESTDQESAETSENSKTTADPIGSGSNERFIPSEEISEDLPVSFPVDI